MTFRYGMKVFLSGVTLAAGVLFGALPANAAQNWCVLDGMLVIDQGGPFYADATCQLAEIKRVSEQGLGYSRLQKSPARCCSGRVIGHMTAQCAVQIFLPGRHFGGRCLYASAAPSALVQAFLVQRGTASS